MYNQPVEENGSAISSYKLTTPVALLVFNRPEATARVFAAIREARPTQLLVVADGPRMDHVDEGRRCEEVREIVGRVDWPCKVQQNYSDINLGCKQRVASGLDWVFKQVEEAIILEDDCLPDQTFFRFCQEMLYRYRNDIRVTSISGTNLLGRWKDDMQSFHFSFYSGIWGWASWRRAWHFYDVDMLLWRDPKSRLRIKDVLGNGRLFQMWALEFDRVTDGHIDTWDYQWTFAQLMQSGLTLTSAVNLVSNIGFNAHATHTINPNNSFSEISTFPCRDPLKMNHAVLADHDYDAALLEKVLAERPLLLKISDFVRFQLSRMKSLR
jgi:hypothetical protein